MTTPKQPGDLPSWATDELYPALGQPWDGTETRIAPLPGELAAGVAPGQMPAQWYNYLQGLGLDHIAALADVPALQWRAVRGDDGGFLSPQTSPFVCVTGCLDAGFRPWLTYVSEGDSAIHRINSENPADDIAGASPNAAANPIACISGAQSQYLVAVDRDTDSSYESIDAGASWSAARAMPVGLGTIGIGYSSEFGLWFAAGTGGIASGTAAPVTAWTSISTASVYRAITPRPGETGSGVLFLHSTSDKIVYTLDGVTVSSAVTLSAGIMDGCWSEAHQAWFVLKSDGTVYRALQLNGTWSAVASLWNNGSTSVYRKIVPFGRNFVILGTDVSHDDAPTAGDAVVTDLTRGTALMIDGGDHRYATTCDGRIVIARTVAGPQLDLAFGARVPWLMGAT